MSKRFGVEIEFLGLGDDYVKIHNLLEQDGRLGMRYTSNLGWDVHEDYSVEEFGDNFYNQGAELVSPPLPYSENGLKQVADAFMVLKDHECYVNESCGFHVHFDARFVNRWSSLKANQFFSYLIQQYANNEEYFDYFVAEHRRKNENEFCRTMKDCTLYKCNKNYDRYYKLNVLSFERHGTIEFRQLQGTLDAKLALKWIEVCHDFFVTCREKFEAMTPAERNAIFVHVNKMDHDEYSARLSGDF